MEGGIWPSQKFWRGASYARPLAGKGEGKGGERNEKGEERESRKRGMQKSWNRAADWLRPALRSSQNSKGVTPSALNEGVVSTNRRFSTYKPPYLRNGARYDKGYY